MVIQQEQDKMDVRVIGWTEVISSGSKDVGKQEQNMIVGVVETTVELT